MRPSLLFNFIGIVGMFTVIHAQNTMIKSDFDYKLNAKKVNTNTWCFLGALEGPNKTNAGNMVNSCYVKTKDSYVVIDSGPSYIYANQAYEAMSKIAKLPVHTVINTHEHDDHWLGNNFYKETFHSKLIGPSLINKNYTKKSKTRMFNVLPPNAIKGTSIVKVDKSPTKTLTLTVGGEIFEIVPIGVKAHTEEDYFIYMPKRKILFSGDLAMNGRITSNRHGSLIGQMKAINMMATKKYEVFIPGHGLDISKDAMTDAKKYFSTMYKDIKKAINDDIDLADISKAVPMTDFKDKAMFDALNGQNISNAYTELEFLEE